MATSFPIRAIGEDELGAWLTVHEHAFHAGPGSARDRASLLARFEFARSLAAFDGAAMVGTAGVFSFQMRVPGALVPMAGVSMVAVLPSHRRRGILSALMTRQLADVHERGEAVAALFASEAGIYQRFGYAPASWQAFWRLAGSEGRLAPGAPTDAGLRLRIEEPAAARAALAKVYDQVLADRPGLFARSDAWWDRVLPEPEEGAREQAPLRCVLAEDDAGPRGYALYTAVQRWDGPAFLPVSTMDIREVMAGDPAAAAALWADLLSRDLVTEVTAPMRPVDDPLWHLLADPRQLRRQVSDGLWVRIVDVGRALGQRRYACPLDAVIEVTDERCPHNQGRWRLATAADGRGSCERTTAAADIRLPVHALAAAYLGGTRLGELARAGLVTQVRPGVLAALSTALSWDPAPWCPLIF